MTGFAGSRKQPPCVGETFERSAIGICEEMFNVMESSSEESEVMSLFFIPTSKDFLLIDCASSKKKHRVIGTMNQFQVLSQKY